MLAMIPRPWQLPFGSSMVVILLAIKVSYYMMGVGMWLVKVWEQSMTLLRPGLSVPGLTRYGWWSPQLLHHSPRTPRYSGQLYYLRFEASIVGMTINQAY